MENTIILNKVQNDWIGKNNRKEFTYEKISACSGSGHNKLPVHSVQQTGGNPKHGAKGVFPDLSKSWLGRARPHGNLVLAAFGNHGSNGQSGSGSVRYCGHWNYKPERDTDRMG